MITGLQLSAILKFNKITYVSFANYLGYNTNSIVANATKLDQIPYTMQQKLGELLNLDLFKEENLKLILDNIPARYYEKKKRSVKVSLINDIFRLK